MSDPTPAGYRRTDPDETMGRWLARNIAERDARMSLAAVRKVKIGSPPQPQDPHP